MNNNRLMASLLATLGALLLAGPPSAFAAPPAPCTLLTAAQVSAVLGVSVGEGQPRLSTLCEWSEPGKSAPGSKKATLTLQNPQAFAFAKTPVPGGGITKTPVSGVGDEAIFGTTANIAAVLTVKKGDVVFVVRVYGFPIDAGKPLEDVQAKEKTLALEIVSKL